MTMPTVFPATPPPPPPRLTTLDIPPQAHLSWKRWVPATALMIAMGGGYLAWRSGAANSRLFGQSPTAELATLAVDEGIMGLVVTENGSLESANNSTVRCQVESLLGLTGGGANAAARQGGMGGAGGPGGAGGARAGGGQPQAAPSPAAGKMKAASKGRAGAAGKTAAVTGAASLMANTASAAAGGGAATPAASSGGGGMAGGGRHTIHFT